MTEPWTGALNAEEQAKIDAAWTTHRDALDVAATEPSDRPKALLDGFGEATDLVIALRAESTRLKALVTSLLSENAHMRRNLAAKDQQIVVAFHAQKRLRMALTRLVELGRDDGAEPDHAWKRAWEQATVALSTRAEATEEEGSESLPTRKSK